MAEQHGGKRTPRNPAPVSGPGKLSRRTDGGPQQVNADMTGMDYGDNQDFNDMQASAPMAASKPQLPKDTAPARGGGSMPAPTGGLFSPSQRPTEPVTAGASFGPGASSGPPVKQNRPPLSSVYARMAADNPSPQVLEMLSMAQRLGY